MLQLVAWFAVLTVLNGFIGNTCAHLDATTRRHWTHRRQSVKLGGRYDPPLVKRFTDWVCTSRI